MTAANIELRGSLEAVLETAMSNKTKLQRDILVAKARNPRATNKQIANRVNCSPSYVSQTLNRYNSYSEFEALFDGWQQDLERMFGDIYG